MSAAVNEKDKKAARALMGADVVNEAAKGLVENPEWDYDEADEAAKDYYRRFAAKCLARIQPILAQALADAREAENRACEDVAKAGHPHCLACCMCADFTTEAIAARRGWAR